MSSSREQIISEARAKGRYRCAQCLYSLDGVPADERGRVICPECGFAMRFVVEVRLARGDDEQIRTRDEALHRGDRMMIIVAVVILVILGVLAVLSVID